MFSFTMKFRPLLHFSRVDERHSFLWPKKFPIAILDGSNIHYRPFIVIPHKKKKAETFINKELYNVVYPPLLTLLKIISRVD